MRRISICSISEIFLDYTPTELSFDYGYSDTWFAYVYDTSDDAGHLGTACYHIEEMDEDVLSDDEDSEEFEDIKKQIEGDKSLRFFFGDDNGLKRIKTDSSEDFESS